MLHDTRPCDSPAGVRDDRAPVIAVDGPQLQLDASGTYPRPRRPANAPQPERVGASKRAGRFQK